MIRYILDTDILTLLQERHSAVVTRVAACPPSELAITVISVEEQLSGWYSRLRRAQKKPDELARVYQRMTTAVSSLSQVPILTFSELAIHRRNALQKLRLKVGKMDLCIAAIALEINAVLVTRNVSDFGRIPGLSIEDWSK
jgi:tRNA(fMet)-specific endonuclease VapC